MVTKQALLTLVESPVGLGEAALTVYYAHMPEKDDIELWQQRLSHVGKSTVNKTKDYLKGLENLYTEKYNVCSCCTTAKSIRIHRATLKRPQINVGYTESSDVVGIMHYSLFGCLKYFVTQLDEYSTHFVVRFEKRKSILGESIIDMIKVFENAFNQNLRKHSLSERTCV